VLSYGAEQVFGVLPPLLTIAVSRAFLSWTRSILTEIDLCHACSYHEVEDGNARTGSVGGQVALPGTAGQARRRGRRQARVRGAESLGPSGGGASAGGLRLPRCHRDPDLCARRPGRGEQPRTHNRSMSRANGRGLRRWRHSTVGRPSPMGARHITMWGRRAGRGEGGEPSTPRVSIAGGAS
jgi:hypothetical protein